MVRIRPALFALGLMIGLASVVHAETYVATLEIPEFETSLTLTADLDASELEIQSVGPADRYFAWGFGATSMAGTYALITNGDGDMTLTERSLGNHSAGSLLTPSLMGVSSSVDTGVLTVVATRTFAAAGSDYFEFTASMIENGDTIDMIWSRGFDTSFSYHGNSNRDFGSAAFDKGVSSTPGDDDTYEVVGASWGQLKVRFEKVER